ncbi:histone-lysine N-methyltransferase SETMAR [Elysia marginata]|uniref:Histone-lysine N-methyltransferase SETMAR n=1 Tax=Elysia marginata TaxID=1093978 RepID=A0AAV4EJ02_9GAST|nr:histone-lysine N-methyltransferase SETMAR [Elysia marginata]
MTWKHPLSPVTKKFKVQRSAAKEMATVLWDVKRVILLDILPQGQYINAAQYWSTLDRRRDAIPLEKECFSTIMRPLIQQTLHSNVCNATVGKFFLILPTVQASHPLTFICLDS